MTKVTCATQGHLWGPLGKCVMCDEPKPSARTDTPVPALSPFTSGTALVYLAYDVDALIKEARELLDGLEISRNQCGVYNGKTWIERRAAFLKATEGVK